MSVLPVIYLGEKVGLIKELGKYLHLHEKRLGSRRKKSVVKESGSRYVHLDEGAEKAKMTGSKRIVGVYWGFAGKHGRAMYC